MSNAIDPRQMTHEAQLLAHLKATDSLLYRIVASKIKAHQERGEPYNPVLLEAFAKSTLAKLDGPQVSEAEKRKLDALRIK
jgi:hypothetical protein